MCCPSCPHCGYRDPRSSSEGISRPYHFLPSSLLQSNAAPAYEEVVVLRQILEDARKDKLWLERRVASMEIALSTYRRNLQIVTRVVHEHELVSCATRSLPAEIILEIAFMTVDSGLIDVLDSTSRGPWYMAQVCKRWRDILTNSTDLWSRIDVKLFRPPKLRNAVPLLMSYIDRSGNQPLHIGFRSKRYSDWTETLFGILIAQSHRWKIIQIHKLFPQMINSLKRVKHKLNLLEELQLSSAESLPTGIDVFYDSPGLRRFSLDDFPNSTNLLVLPWSQLTSYSAYQDNIRDHLAVLQKTPNLTECSLVSHQNKDSRTSRTKTVLRNLQQLYLRDTAVSLLESIRAPRLEILRVESLNSANLGKGSFLGFISSTASLRTLSVSCPLPADELSKVITHKNLSTLENLTLDLEIPRGSTLLDVVLGVLEHKDDRHSYSLPRLEHLSLTIYSSAESKPNVLKLVEMVESRCRMLEQRPDRFQPAKLRSFRLEMNCSWDVTFERLKVLCDEGLDITLRLR
ncbi:hypothetical protein K435DRAFT_832764 [Dendrothele bispora CBS 962.96]|uniref:Uncharacterized protein n=1 Tax=Dendrothele bispora (strain CBS 962.96) TaxID=1314807 RepID=A0A4S8MXT0_DENBC|nr:hypothetical protein K435DRAFT_832764 [Dendrothele bispora CBS 962.96]